MTPMRSVRTMSVAVLVCARDDHDDDEDPERERNERTDDARDRHAAAALGSTRLALAQRDETQDEADRGGKNAEVPDDERHDAEDNGGNRHAARRRERDSGYAGCEPVRLGPLRSVPVSLLIRVRNAVPA